MISVRGVARAALMAAMVLLAAGAVQAVVIDTVTVGNPGNAADTRYETPGYGAVAYSYNIGKYEVTAGQYCAFLNAVAADDPYALYDPQMWVPGPYYPAEGGCKIERLGSARNYTYRVAADVANRPVNFVSFWDTCRFANWLHNGQPLGGCDRITTEDGAYAMNGYMGDDGGWITRKSGARWVIPTQDEWYKAAYHKNDGITANYWTFPTASELLPFNDVINPDPGDSANFYQGGYSIGAPYYRTEVGEFENSASPYGTFDQGGNVSEYNESFWPGNNMRILRGGNFDATAVDIWTRGYVYPYAPYAGSEWAVGFRVAQVPEPATLALLACGALLFGSGTRMRRKQV
jgi:formylglycine-generating enzyme required for sulfatase activity